jgi:3-dehydroquinate synthase
MDPIKIDFYDQISSVIFLDKNLSKIDIIEGYNKAFCVIDSNAEWYFDDSKLSNYQLSKFIFENPDESKKSQQTVQNIHDFLFQNNADRKSLLIAVGGGITLDVAGYAASIYKRGIDWIAIPTTLLAQVDASVGGKTAINHPMYGKNVIGSFHPPIKVFIDSTCSLTWSDELRLEGIAEMYKIFKIFDHKAATELLKKPNEKLTKRSIELKAKVVEIDPYERNLRAILNYGHTFGHAIETLVNDENDYRKLPHGIAVSIGIRLENLVALELGLMKEAVMLEIERDLDSFDFPRPTTLPPFDDIITLMLQDKKTKDDIIQMCIIDGVNELLFEPKDPRIKVDISTLKIAYEHYLQVNK